MTTTAVEFYFDPISPYAWLATEQIDKILVAGGRIVCRPILFAALLNAHGTKGPAEVPAKRSYVFRDAMRQAEQMHLQFRGPPNHPFNPLAALRVIQAGQDESQRLNLARHLLAATWRDGIDISNVRGVHAALREGGFDADALCAASATPEVKLRLRETTQGAIDAGIFGVPTFRVRGEIFWGADRMDAVVWAIRGGTIDEMLYQAVLARPAAATR